MDNTTGRPPDYPAELGEILDRLDAAPTKDEIAKAIRAANERGMPMEQIAAELGMTRSGMHRRYLAAGALVDGRRRGSNGLAA
jgi:hypothetical protein